MTIERRQGKEEIKGGEREERNRIERLKRMKKEERKKWKNRRE